MRDIRFRGKNIKTNDWAYGYYVHIKDTVRNRETHRIYNGFGDSFPDTMTTYDFSGSYEEVDPETIGQFTGLHDENDKPIYDGDIVRYKTGSTRNPETGEWFDNVETIVVETGDDASCNISSLSEITNNITVIGNIYDHSFLVPKEK